MLYQELIGILEGEKILGEIISPRIFESSQSLKKLLDVKISNPVRTVNIRDILSLLSHFRAKSSSSSDQLISHILSVAI